MRHLYKIYIIMGARDHIKVEQISRSNSDKNLYCSTCIQVVGGG